MQKQSMKWVVIMVVVIILFVFSLIAAGIVSLFFIAGETGKTGIGNVALIPVKGVIMTEKGSGFFGESIVSSTDINSFIEDAGKDSSIKAIIFEIDSPGGSAVASEEIANAIKKVNKTTVALIRESGTSGAYWIASATDYIIANRMSITGSIGVISSYLDFSGLLQDYNVTHERLVAGDYKDIGTPLKKMTNAEREIFQSKIGKIHEFFIDEVAKNRNLPKEKVKEISTGLFYIGSEAKELGLVDELGGKEEAVNYLEKKLNTTIEIVEYVKNPSLLDILSGVFDEKSFFVGKGIGSAFFEKSRTASKVEVWA